VTAFALTGSFATNPLTELGLEAPSAEELPAKGFDHGESAYSAPTDDPDSITVQVAADSERLALLEPFEPVAGIVKSAGQMHHRPHFTGWTLAEISRSPRSH